MIKYVSGDLLKSDCDVIVHGCNCFRRMGAGIAAQIKSTYPEAFLTDFGTPYKDAAKLGTFSHVKLQNKYFPEKEVYIVNAYTQYNYGRKPGYVYAKYDAIENVMRRINDYFIDTEEKQFKIGMPKIGAGLAAGDWNKISAIIENIFGNKEIYVYELNTKQEIENTDNSYGDYVLERQKERQKRENR